MNFNKICILHLNQIGDLVFSLPLLKALRDNFPGATIHSVVKPYLKDLLVDSPYVNKITLRERGLRARFKLLKLIRQNRYDLVVSLASSEESLLLTSLSKAQTKAGFAHFPWDIGLNIKERIEGHNSWKNNVKILNNLKITVLKDDYVGLLHTKQPEHTPLLPDAFAVISPGASRKRQIKEWLPEKFAELMLRLNKELNLASVLVGGKENRSYNRTIIELMKIKDANNFEILDLTGKTSLKPLCGIIKQAALFVGIDSGIMHMASAIDIPVVGLFGPTDPFYVAPQNKRSIVVQNSDMECIPCYLKPCNHPECMKNLSVNKVMDACVHLLT